MQFYHYIYINKNLLKIKLKIIIGVQKKKPSATHAKHIPVYSLIIYIKITMNHLDSGNLLKLVMLSFRKHIMTAL